MTNEQIKANIAARRVLGMSAAEYYNHQISEADKERQQRVAAVQDDFNATLLETLQVVANRKRTR